MRKIERRSRPVLKALARLLHSDRPKVRQAPLMRLVRHRMRVVERSGVTAW